MKEEKVYAIYYFTGVTVHLYNRVREEKMSLESCLKDVYNTAFDADTMGLKKRFNFSREFYTLDELQAKIGSGMSIFPFSKTMDIDIVRNHIKMGLYPVFMNAKEFQDFKKDYK